MSKKQRTKTIKETYDHLFDDDIQPLKIYIGDLTMVNDHLKIYILVMCITCNINYLLLS